MKGTMYEVRACFKLEHNGTIQHNVDVQLKVQHSGRGVCQAQGTFTNPDDSQVRIDVTGTSRGVAVANWISKLLLSKEYQPLYQAVEDHTEP